MNWAGIWYNANLYKTLVHTEKPIELCSAKRKIMPINLCVYYKKENTLNERKKTTI